MLPQGKGAKEKETCYSSGGPPPPSEGPIACYCVELHGIVWYCMVLFSIFWLVNWLRRAGCISEDTYLLYIVPNTKLINYFELCCNWANLKFHPIHKVKPHIKLPYLLSYIDGMCNLYNNLLPKYEPSTEETYLV